MYPAVYDSAQLKAWEQRWFAAGNSGYGLMQQAAWQMTQYLIRQLEPLSITAPVADPVFGVWCGAGNNGGDGWLMAAYLKQAGFSVWVYAVTDPHTADATIAQATALSTGIAVYTQLKDLPPAHVDMDALFGIGLSRPVSGQYQMAIEQFNQRRSYKVAVDIPSGLHANTGAVLGIACRVDMTLTVLGYKAGLLTGQGAAYAGQVQLVELIPPDEQLQALARLDCHTPELPKRSKTSHKGSHGHVLVVGGNKDMGGAAIMAAEAALVVGAGKVTLLSHEKHHSAALTRCPNMLTLSMPAREQISSEWACTISQGMDSIVLGMGVGRDDWSRAVWQAFLPLIDTANHFKTVLLDADALWHLADETSLNPERHEHWYSTPHPGEAARLLGIGTAEVEQDRIAAIYALKQKYGGSWVLKGAGSLSLDNQGLSICELGNAGMATAGMGDILAGMAGGLLTQLPDLRLHKIVALHAAAGDLLAQSGERGMQATDMLTVMKQMVNNQQADC